MEPSIDNKINRNKEQQYVEGAGEKRKPNQSNAGSGSSSQLDRINAALNRPGIPESAKAHLLQEKHRLTNGMAVTGGIAGISIEDTKALLQQLQRFQETIRGDWRSVISQWQNLQNCWQDRQCDRFEPFFEELCRTYEQCEQQCQEYTQFLEERIRGSEDAAATLNM